MLVNVLVEYNNEYKQKNTKSLRLLTTKEPQFIPNIDPYTEARYLAINQLNHQGSVLRDNTNCTYIPTSKGKNRANTCAANSPVPETPKQKEGTYLD